MLGIVHVRGYHFGISREADSDVFHVIRNFAKKSEGDFFPVLRALVGDETITISARQAGGIASRTLASKASHSHTTSTVNFFHGW